MLMAIDVGNTNTEFGLLEGDKLIGTFRLMTDANKTSDEIGLTVCQYFSHMGLRVDQVENIIITSVVPQVMYSLTSAVLKYFGKRPIIIGEDIAPDIRYEGNEKLGADRAVACIAAREKYGKPTIVLDFGTATTVDAVDANGVYLGGCILAGVRVATDALFRQAAMLPRIELVCPPHVLGQNTIEQIQVGSVVGYIGAIEHLVRRTRAEMPGGAEARVVATGGLARLVADNSDVIDVVDSELIIEGLRIIYENWKREHHPEDD